MLKITVDTLPLYKAMRELSRETRKDMDFIIRQQCGIMVGQLIATTPPGEYKSAWSSEGGISLDARKRGEARIAEEINAIFPTSRLPDKRVQGMIDAGYWWGVGRQRRQVRNFAPTMAELKQLHKAARSPSTGRVRKLNGAFMAVTRTSARKALIKAQQAKVGRLNAGWMKAAQGLKTSARNVPAWIRRHGAQPGSLHEMMTVGGILITMANNMPYFPGDIGKRIDALIPRREHAIRKQLAAITERKAQRANAAMR